MDTSILSTLSLIAPDLMQELEIRTLILERVAALGPIGRRALAGRLSLPERTVRAATDALCEAGCIVKSTAGMEISEEGRRLVETARMVSRERRCVQALEMSLSRKLHIERVCVVRGDLDRDAGVMSEVAQAAAQQLRFLLHGTQVLAVSGGRTVAAMAGVIAPAAPMEITVVPLHGGMGGASQTQANTVAERIAQALGGHHRLLHLPDGLPRSAAAELASLPQVREALELLRHADVLLYGVGRAQELAVRRGMSRQEQDDLTAHGAVGEALGFYFDMQGRVVGGASLALSEEELGRSSRTAMIAAGGSKAAAMAAVLRHHPHALLVTDEGAAQGILEILRSEPSF